jgi:putative transposase
MPRAGQRFHQSGQSHFLTFSCYRRRANFISPETCDLMEVCLENMRGRFAMRLRICDHAGARSSAQQRTRAGHYSRRHAFSKELSFVKRLRCPSSAVESGSFWQKRYYDRNVRDAREFTVKLRYLHRNPVKRGLVKEAGDWKWSSFRHYALREIGIVEIESEWTARDREAKPSGSPARTFLLPG